LLQKKQQAEIAKASNIAKASILDYANNLRVRQTSATSGSIYQKNIIISAVLGLLLIVLLEFINNKVVDKSDIESNTNIPILGYIGHNKKKNNLLLFSQPKSLISEAFRTIRTNIQYVSHKEGCKIVMITSSVGGEGKTFCSMNVASSYALLKKKTILIGADLRKPRIFDDFGVNNNVGLSTLLIGKASIAEATQKTDNEFLDLITSGPIPPNPSELLSSPEFNDLIEQLKTKYDQIILDTSPIGLVTDARILINMADVVLLIVRQKYTRIPNFTKITKELEAYHEKCGIIINDIQEKRIGYGKYSYSYGYGYGYGYGYEYGYGYGSGYEEQNEAKKKSFLKRKKS
jgi:capsular exopolysaccharide synthesis family protein